MVRRRSRAGWSASLAVAGLLLGAPPPGGGGEGPAGRAVYERHCAVCHGPDGRGDGEAAPRLRTPPADLTAGRYKFRSTPSGAAPTDEDLAQTLRRGVRGTAMVPQTQLAPEELQAVVAYVKTLAPGLAERARPPVTPPAAPPATPGVLTRGARLFKDSGCPECHGDGGRGDGPSSRKGMTDARGLPIVPTDLTRRPFKRGSDPLETWKSIALGLDGTPMPSYADALDAAETWAIVLFLEALAPPERRAAEDRLLPGEELLGEEIERASRIRP